MGAARVSGMLGVLSRPLLTPRTRRARLRRAEHAGARSALVCALAAAVGLSAGLANAQGEAVTEASPARPSPSDGAGTTPRRRSVRDEMMLSVEGVTRAPIDIGVQAVFEAPFGLRFSGGYGWLPSAYTGMLSGIAANVSNDAATELVLSRASYRGNTWRVQLGVRPFRRVGLYIDAGYSHLQVDSALDLADTGAVEVLGLTGGYEGTLLVDLWLVELGYQAQIARRLVWGVALGATGTLDAQTTISPTGGAVDGPELAETEDMVDRAVEAYGVVPTLTLRLGVDLI